MRTNKIKEMMTAGAPVINGWCSLPCTYAAEVMAHQGYDSLTIDLQHGAMAYDTAFSMLQAISTTDTVPMARVPWHDPGIMMKLIDAGAYGLICPMVNSAEIARQFVAACRYPPVGHRSFGPNRATLYARAGSSANYAAGADSEILLFAMIETKAGLDNLNDIISVDGLDGVYVGPGDLSLALGAAPSMAPTGSKVVAAMDNIRETAKALGKFAAVHTDGPATARKRFAEGFQLCTLQNDVRILADGAKAQVQAAKEG